MRPTEIQHLHEYAYWAANVLLSKAEEVTPEEFAAPSEFPHGGLRGTFAHWLAAMNVWYVRIVEKNSPTSLQTFAEIETVTEMRDAFAAMESRWRTYLDGLDEATLDTEVSWTNTRGVSASIPLWVVLTHLVTHATQHNSELAQMLTSLGHSPRDIDMLYWQIRFAPKK